MENKDKVKQIYGSWKALVEDRKELNEQMKDLIEEASTLSNTDKKVVRKAFSFLLKKEENSEDELDAILTFTTEVE